MGHKSNIQPQDGGGIVPNAGAVADGREVGAPAGHGCEEDKIWGSCKTQVTVEWDIGEESQTPEEPDDAVGP
jgi:hypothetical protein